MRPKTMSMIEGPAMMTPFPKPAFRFTGWHMSAILAVFFGVVIAVNFTMARLASSSFSGVVVKNSYDASQHYNQWLDEAAREKALGWSAVVGRLPDGRISVLLRGAGVPEGAALSGEAWHPLGLVADHDLRFVAQGRGAFVSAGPLVAGRWKLRLMLEQGGKPVWHGQEKL